MPVPQLRNELARDFEGMLCGEMAVAEIAAAGGIDLPALQANDSDPMEVVVRIPVGRSTRGWYYTPAAIQAFVASVNDAGLPGFLGHQEEYRVATEFPTPVTHWVGAVWNEGEQAAYFRGVIDPSQPDLKRWIRANAVRQVSIYGNMALEYDYHGDAMLVVGAVPLSIDWTPLNRAGMPTSVVATGELDTTNGGIPMTLEQIIEALKKAMSGGYSVGKLAGEMGWTAEQLAREVNPTWLQQLTGDTALVGEIRSTLGVAADGDVLAKVRELLTGAHQARVAGLVQTHVAGEIAQTLVSRMLRSTPEQTDEQIAGEIKALLDDPAVKTALGLAHEDLSSGVQRGGGDDKRAQGEPVVYATL